MSSSSAKKIRFQCPHCSAVLKGSASNAGKERKCPKCEQTFRIPRPKNVETNDAPEKQIAQKEQALVPVVCGVCSTRMYARADQIGQSMECPDCFTQNLIKEPPKEAKPSGPSMETGRGYDLEPQQEIEITKTHGEELLAAADEAVEKQLEEEPDTPKRPFVDGVLLYPLRLRIFPIVIGMVLAWSLVLGMVKLAWDLKGKASAITPMLLAGSAIVLLMVVFPTLVSFQKIFENTSNLDDDSEIRPDGGMFAFIDWIGECMPIMVATFFSVAPGIAIVKGLQLPTVAYAGVGVAAYLLFPLVLMSMMESASVFGIFSRPVWSSLFQIPAKWFRFYFFTAIQFVFFAAGIGGLVYVAQTPLDGRVIAIAVVSLFASLLSLTGYFRTLGRLAWIMSQELLVDAVEHELVDTSEPAENDAEMSLGV